ncbi:MAG: DUF2141 domain-containing protein [Pseudomonadota bacterium]
MKSLNKITIATLAAMALGAPDLAQSETETGQPVKVLFTGINPETGTLWISLCTREEVPKISQGGCAHSAKIAAKEGAEHTFNPSAPGVYVISAYHDDNDNGQLDFDDQGIPFEAIGNSRNAVGEFGPPSFDQTKFDVRARSQAPQALSLTIEMRRIELP